MKYQATCKACAWSGDVTMRAAEYATFKAQGKNCPTCSEGMIFPVFQPDKVQFSFKGDAWSDKNLREKDYRNKRSQYLGKKQKDSNFVSTLQPNYNGMEVDSWRDAQHLAETEGKDTETYEPLVQSEIKS